MVLLCTSLGSPENNSYLVNEGVIVVRIISTSPGSTENNSYLADKGVVVVRTHLYITWLHREQLLSCRRGSCCGQDSSLHHLVPQRTTPTLQTQKLLCHDSSLYHWLSREKLLPCGQGSCCGHDSPLHHLAPQRTTPTLQMRELLWSGLISTSLA